MAGSKIFLEPILAETVNGVDGAIQDVITVLDPVPGKIDEQINKLSEVVGIIGSSISNVNIVAYDGILFKVLAAGIITSTNFKSASKTVHCAADGTLRLKVYGNLFMHCIVVEDTSTSVKITVVDETTSTTVKEQTFTGTPAALSNQSGYTVVAFESYDFDFTCNKNHDYTVTIETIEYNMEIVNMYNFVAGFSYKLADIIDELFVFNN